MSIENEITLDFARPERTGLSEAIFCAGKSIEQLREIFQQIKAQQSDMLFTRLEADAAAALDPKGELDYDPVSRTAIYRAEKPAAAKKGVVAVVTGGSSDVPVAREIERTLGFFGFQAQAINDVGVAGLWRLQSRLDDIKKHKVVICVAGMDAALPTVLGGLISSVIIAVPSSVGYGMAKGGETALQSLLCSCAPGLVVVNIDNGYGAACAALRYLNHS